MTDQAMRNVGTDLNPVSWLHQRAVALLYDELTRPDCDEEIRARLTPDGDLSHNLREGVAKVKVPNEWDNVGGVVPDLILYGNDDKPIRIIEVIVTSPPDDRKRGKLDTLRSRGVDVVEITVKEERDLLSLCWVPRTPRFTALTGGDSFGVNWPQNQEMRLKHLQQNQLLQDLMTAIQACSPKVRRDLCNVLKHLETLDSLYPVRPTNPYREKLSEDGKPDPQMP